jgi:hypothetical protein
MMAYGRERKSYKAKLISSSQSTSFSALAVRPLSLSPPSTSMEYYTEREPFEEFHKKKKKKIKRQ